MKKYGYSIAVVLMIVMIAVSAVFVGIMPEQIPVHYGASGAADRFGSKFECLLFPVIGVICGAVMLVLAKCQRKKENGSEKAHLVSANVVLLFLNIFQVYFLWLSYSYGEGDKGFAADSSLVSILVGAMFMIIGNFMPKITRNKALGVRLPWTMKNDVCWQKSHRFSGVVFVAAGLLLVLNGIFFKTTACTIIVMVILLLMVAVTCIGTYMICKKAEV